MANKEPKIVYSPKVPFMVRLTDWLALEPNKWRTYGTYDRTENTIWIDSTLSPEEQKQVLKHELAHSRQPFPTIPFLKYVLLLHVPIWCLSGVFFFLHNTLALFGLLIFQVFLLPMRLRLQRYFKRKEEREVEQIAHF